MSQYLLEMNHISKTFAFTKALDQVNLRIKHGQVHALMGANGAGKSTLMKILSGIYRPDSGSGEIMLDGKAFSPSNPTEAQNAGVSIVFQELTVIQHLSVLENIFLNREITRHGFYDWKAMRARALEIMKDLDVSFDLNQKVLELPIAQQQMVEIVKAVSTNAKLVILDEPTSSLSQKETRILFSIMRKLRERGVTIVYISHRMEEIYNECTDITLLRDGKWILTDKLENISREALIQNMLGRKLSEEFPARERKDGEELLRVEALTSAGSFRDISLTLHRHEVLGLAGLVGAGRTELAKAIFGEYPIVSGDVYIEGKKVTIRSSRDALNLGVAYATEDRKKEGLLLGRSLRENISLPCLNRFTAKGPLIDRAKERENAGAQMDALRVKSSGMEQHARELSGGNQQKICLAKWLSVNPKILILDEPTRGIDVGAKAEFYQIIARLAGEGVGILCISSEESELMGICDRIMVLREGAYAGSIDPKVQTEEDLAKLMFAEVSTERGVASEETD